MLVVNPYPNYDNLNKPPRIISEIRKQEVCPIRDQIRPRISGELLVLIGAERTWSPRRVIVRGGQLLLGAIQGESCSGIRIPLRQLSLRAGSLPNSLALIKGQSILLTLQTLNERAFEIWVKAIAIELIRQTPLEAVRYLDILTLTECNEKKIKDCNSNYISEKPNFEEERKSSITFPECDLEEKREKNTTSTVEVLLKKCQSAENYVPVREKLVLFESLCRIGRVQSTEDVSNRVDVYTKRARSMHDLSYCFTTGGVREICKYFETKVDTESTKNTRKNKRLIHSDSNLSKVKFLFDRNLQNVSHA